MSDTQRPARSRPTAGRGVLDVSAEYLTVRFQRLLDTNAVGGLGFLRRRRPLLNLRRIVVVTRRVDVLDVLADPATFPLPYAARLPGDFVLGLAGARHERHRGELRAVLRAEDLDRWSKPVATDADQRVDEARARGSLDVGADLVHPVFDAFVGGYLGAPGPDPQTQLRWGRALFRDIFLNPGNLATIRERADVAAGEMFAHLEGLIAARKAAGDGQDDVLGRLLQRQRTHPDTALSDDEIRDNLMGLTIGWLWHGAKSGVVAVDELLRRPDALARARTAAADDDPEPLRRVLWETLRFRPVQPGLLRGCARETLLGAGTPRASRIRPGAVLFVGTHSAMWDDAEIPDSAAFDETRAVGQYLIFGDGPHRCLGEQIMRAQLPAVLAPLLRVDGLRRAPGRAGRMRWAGPDPDGFRVVLPR